MQEMTLAAAMEYAAKNDPHADTKQQFSAARRKFHLAHLKAIDAVEEMAQAKKEIDNLLDSILFPS